MNKFIPQTGGHNLHLNEFSLIQDAYLEGFKALIKKISPTGNTILDGIVVDSSGANVVNTSGYIAILGEIYKVESGSFTNSGGVLYFKPIETTLAPPSPITYQDTLAKNVHFQRKAILKYKDISDTDGVLYSDLTSVSTIIEGSVISWSIPTGKIIADFFDNTGLGVSSAIGYAICNGLYGTIDLRGLIIGMATNVPATGAGAINTNVSGITNNYLDIGGSNLYTLLQTNLPLYDLAVSDLGHTHTGVAKEANTSGGAQPFALGLGGNTGTVTTNNSTTGITVSSGGSGTAMNIRQATKYLYYIQKIK